MLYCVTMNRTLSVALVVCVILFVVTIFISPVVDLQPTALRAQQWLGLIYAMFSFALQTVVLVLPVLFCIRVPKCDMPFLHRVCPANLACCLLC